MKLLNLTSLIALVAFPFAAVQAGEVCVSPLPCKAPICCDRTGYVFGYGGINFGYDNDIQSGGQNFDFDFEEGYIIGAGAGIYSDLLCGSRFELEGIYANNDIDSVTLAGARQAITGDSRVYAVMANALKEIPLGCITAYAGGGIGYAWSEISANGLSDRDGALAYQFIAGGDLPITDCISLFAQYKLLGISDTDYRLAGANFSADSYFTHSVSVGARLSF